MLFDRLTCRLRLVLQYLWTESHGVDGNDDDSGGGYTDGGGKGRGGEEGEKEKRIGREPEEPLELTGETREIKMVYNVTQM